MRCVVTSDFVLFISCRWSRIFNSNFLAACLTYGHLYFNVIVVAFLILFFGKVFSLNVNNAL